MAHHAMKEYMSPAAFQARVNQNTKYMYFNDDKKQRNNRFGQSLWKNVCALSGVRCISTQIISGGDYLLLPHHI